MYYSSYLFTLVSPTVSPRGHTFSVRRGSQQVVANAGTVCQAVDEVCNAEVREGSWSQTKVSSVIVRILGFF